MPNNSEFACDDGFHDDAIRQELLRIVDGEEIRLRGLMSDRMKEMRRKFDSLSDVSESDFQEVLSRLDAANEKAARRFDQMRSFIECR